MPALGHGDPQVGRTTIRQPHAGDRIEPAAQITGRRYHRACVADVLNLYLDDSGTRNPDRNPRDELPFHGHDWFGLGGIMIRESDEAGLRTQHAALYTKWKPFGMEKPLHSNEIRSQNKGFRWMRECSPAQRIEFYDDIERLATHPQLTAIACVIDRPGYNKRYLAKYGTNRWLLCNTAFSIVVERSVKYAQKLRCRLRVNVERSDKTVDTLLLSYYNELRSKGPPFDADTSATYSPLAAQVFADTLYEFQTKNKTSPPMQIADVCLWPMCIGGYQPDNKPYVALRMARSLVDCKLSPDEVPTSGIKYSCWDLPAPAGAGDSGTSEK